MVEGSTPLGRMGARAMTDIIRDWLRHHPELSLTKDQADSLEEIINEDRSDHADYYADYYDTDYDEVRRLAFTGGAKAMQNLLAAYFLNEDIEDMRRIIGSDVDVQNISDLIKNQPDPDWADWLKKNPS
jgi:hypothetical protein